MTTVPTQYRQPSKEQLKSFRSLKTVRIVVDQSYGEAVRVTLPFEEFTKTLLQHAGIKVVKARSNNYDATLKIQATGKPLGAYYNDGQFHYTAASLSGTISFEIPHRTSYRKSFQGRKTPPSFFSPAAHLNRYTNPSSAPFSSTFGSFSFKLTELVAEVFGIAPLIRALKEGSSHDFPFFANTIKGALERIAPNWRNSEVSERAIPDFITTLKDSKKQPIQFFAAKALDEIAPDWRNSNLAKLTVDDCIHALKDKDPSVRRAAAWALGAIRNSHATESLIEALKDQDESVQCDAAWALGEINDRHAVSPLIELLKEGNACELKAAVALEKITGREFWNRSKRAKSIKWWEQD